LKDSISFRNTSQARRTVAFLIVQTNSRTGISDTRDRFSPMDAIRPYFLKECFCYCKQSNIIAVKCLQIISYHPWNHHRLPLQHGIIMQLHLKCLVIFSLKFCYRIIRSSRIRPGSRRVQVLFTKYCYD